MKRRLVVKLGLLVATLALCVLLGEAAYRVSVYGWGGLSPALMESTLKLSRSGVLQASDNPEIRFELRPGFRRLHQMALHETNSRGLRDDEYPLAKPDGTRRIAFIGDSFTMGLGVEHDEIYLEIVERRLNALADGVRYECLNFGVAGYGLLEYAGVLRHRALAYDPDLVVIALTANDRIPTHENFTIAREPDDPFWELHGVEAAWAALGERLGWEVERERRAPVPDALSPGEPHDPDAGDALPPMPVFDVPPEQWPDALPPAAMAHLREWFAVFAGLADETGVPVVLVFLTQSCPGNPQGTKNSQAFRKVAAEVGLPYVDTSPYFRGRTLHDTIIFTNDTHPNALGHALLGDAVYDTLRAGGWLAP